MKNDDDAPRTFTDDQLFDLMRGVAALTDSAIVSDLARVIAEAPRADLSTAFNHKQIGSKLWLRDAWIGVKRPGPARALIVGGWLGVLSAILLNDARAEVAIATSLDIDPDCAPAALALNRRFAAEGRFDAVTADMRAYDYRRAGHDWVINTSCEHIPDLGAWLALLPPRANVILQSNDYRREPDHVACVDSLQEFEEQARLSRVLFRGERPTKNYRRFMLIGET